MLWVLRTVVGLVSLLAATKEEPIQFCCGKLSPRGRAGQASQAGLKLGAVSPTWTLQSLVGGPGFCFCPPRVCSPHCSHMVTLSPLKVTPTAFQVKSSHLTMTTGHLCPGACYILLSLPGSMGVLSCQMHVFTESFQT